MKTKKSLLAILALSTHNVVGTDTTPKIKQSKQDEKEMPLSILFSPMYHNNDDAFPISGFFVPQYQKEYKTPLKYIQNNIKIAQQDCVKKGGDPKVVDLIGNEMFLQQAFITNKCHELPTKIEEKKCENMALIMSRDSMEAVLLIENNLNNLSGCDGEKIEPQLNLFAITGPITYLKNALDRHTDYSIKYTLEEGYSPYNCYDGAIGKIKNGFSGHMSSVKASEAKEKINENGFTEPVSIEKNDQHCIQIWKNEKTRIIQHYTASIKRNNITIYSSKNGEEAHLLVPNLNVLKNKYLGLKVIKEQCRPAFEKAPAKTLSGEL